MRFELRAIKPGMLLLIWTLVICSIYLAVFGRSVWWVLVRDPLEREFWRWPSSRGPGSFSLTARWMVGLWASGVRCPVGSGSPGLAGILRPPMRTGPPQKKRQSSGQLAQIHIKKTAAHWGLQKMPVITVVKEEQNKLDIQLSSMMTANIWANANSKMNYIRVFPHP